MHMSKHKYKQIIMDSYINKIIYLLLKCGTQLMSEFIHRTVHQYGNMQLILIFVIV